MIFEPNYNLWLTRVHRINELYHTQKIDETTLHHFQHYILSFGVFNANFTLQELQSLSYPKSPFNTMNRHSYLRGSETWATEILRQLYNEAYPSSIHSYPVFIDSELFWDEARQYTTIIDADTVPLILDAPDSDIWVLLNSPEEKNAIAESIRQVIISDLIDKKVPQDLQDLFRLTTHDFSPEEKMKLEFFLRDEFDYCKKEFQSRTQSLKGNHKRDKKWYGLAYGQFKKNNPSFLKNHDINTVETLQQFALSNSELFDEAYDKLELAPEKATDERQFNTLYLQAIARWIKQETAKPLERLYYFFIPNEKFMGIDSMVLLGDKEAKSSDNWGPKALINHLGYRVGQTRAINAILEHYPLLFVDKSQTQSLWKRLMQTSMISSLPDTERDEISNLCDAMSITNDPVVKNFDEVCRRFENTKCMSVSRFYKQFIEEYLLKFRAVHQQDSLFYSVVVPELIHSMECFIKATKQSHDGGIQHAVRAVQIIVEILQLDLAYSPFNEQFNVINVIKNTLLSSYPVQSVLMAPYGMRANMRVFQAGMIGQQTDRPKQVFVTNQNYFEWLINLNNLHTKLAEITYVRQLEDIDESADYIFAEIHPNNVTEKKQFAHHIEELIKRMHTPQWLSKPRTLVLDVTLNAFDDQEVRAVLDLASPLVDAGLLNIVMMQSLTKFCQIGLDKLSGGITVVINNDDTSWQAVNAQYQLIAQKEPAEQSVLRYFSYFFNSRPEPHLLSSITVQYITSVTNRVGTLYHYVLEKLAAKEPDQLQYFQLTTSSDEHSCYLSFNTSGILAAVDYGFQLSSHDLEQLNQDIVEQILVPLCRRQGLPISQRMSIAFPLCSVNLALDSIRFTVGLESIIALKHYRDCLVYTSLSINSLKDIGILFDKNSRGEYEQRARQFKEILEGYWRQYISFSKKQDPVYNGRVYGPYTTINGPAYFLYNQNKLMCIVGRRIYKSEQITILQESIITPCTKLSAEQVHYFLNSVGYQKKNNAREFLNQNPKMAAIVQTQYQPLDSDRTNFIFVPEGIGVERDYVCVKKHGMTVFKRAFSQDATAIEMDYWHEKDMVISRFLTFVTALYVKTKYHADFKVQGSVSGQSSMYQYFLFQMNYDAADHFFSDALDQVFRQKNALLGVLRDYHSHAHERNLSLYRFYSNPEPGAPYDNSVFNGPSQFDSETLVFAILDTLGIGLSNKPSPLPRQGSFFAGTRELSNSSAMIGSTDNLTSLSPS